MLRFIFSFLFFTIYITVYSQQPDLKNDYIPLVSSGKLPDIYLKSASEKANNDFELLNNTKGVKNKSQKKKFYLESNFQQDKLFRSGRLLFNDAVSSFVNKVADETLKSAPEIRKQIQLFVVKSDVVNAYCFDNGVILITTGLIAQLDNEAQLAYIISHEISHFIKKHSIESYIDKNVRSGRFSTNVDMDEYKYNQDNELEADVQGVKYFKESKYSYKGITGAFNVLKYSYLPFDEIAFDKTFFEDSNLVFSNDFFLKEISPIKKDENYDDSKSTHPQY